MKYSYNMYIEILELNERRIQDKRMFYNIKTFIQMLFALFFNQINGKDTNICF